MEPSETLEALMLLCFSIGWYWSIGSMILTGKPYGKSNAFVACTICGYILGVTSKLWDWQLTAEFSYLLLVYTWNLAIAALDLFLLVRFSDRSRQTIGAEHVISQALPRVDGDWLHLTYARSSTAANDGVQPIDHAKI